VTRYLCVHGHFYQPPRENPWLEEVEIQDSAYPYHDWNERITVECYAPNGSSRILDKSNKIIDIVNNYEKISFNFGPTLLSWMKRNRSHTYQQIIKADKESQKNFSGHGSAIAQVYNHMIMPLSNSRDKRTQIYWGIKDFTWRFQREPEGMWLAETAVDMETLDIMADEGIKFTILSPYQAKKVKPLNEKKWTDVSGGKIDPKVPYLCRLSSGRTISIFFYDGPVSQDVAFGGLLDSGENFANRLLGTFSKEQKNAQLVHIATDGETYGHHHSFGEMALSYGYNHISSQKTAQITVYGEFLEKFPPEHEVQIIENSSWSCFHGVERWRNDCGCKIDANSGWNQSWRVFLRQGMDWLRDKLIQIFQEQMSKYVNDPWKARDEYINVVLERKPEVIKEFLLNQANRELSDFEKTSVIKLLEMQRHAMLMYTSCGWFFDDISGIEAVQVLQYAARAIQLAKGVSGIDLEPEYLKILKNAKSNIEEFENGAKIYQMHVKDTVVDLKRVASHYAVSALFHNYFEEEEMYCYKTRRKSQERQVAGKQQIITGSVWIQSKITLESAEYSYAVLHLGDHIVFGGVCPVLSDEVFIKMTEDIKADFQKSNVSDIISLLDRYLGDHNCSLWHVFRDEQRKILKLILTSTLREIDISLRQLNEHHYPIMLAMKEIGIPLPQVFLSTFSFIFNTDIKNLLKSEQIDMERLQDLVKEVKRWSLNLDKTTLGFIASKKINLLIENFNKNPQDADILKSLETFFKTLQPLSLPLRIWEAQNVYFAIKNELYDIMQAKLKQNDKTAKKWISNFDALGNYLSIRSR